MVGSVRSRHLLRKRLPGAVVFIENNCGAAYVTRTRDPIITNDVLYQLS